MEHQLVITPKTKIADLLEAYPGLEEILIAQAPAFRKLQNPVLRKTVARVTSLSQAAAIGGLKVEELVNILRKEAGQTAITELESSESHYNTIRPNWFRDKWIVRTIDIREILNEGNQPVHEVLSAVRELKNKEILYVIAPFLPAPLIDKAIASGHEYWIDRVSEEVFHIYFRG